MKFLQVFFTFVENQFARIANNEIKVFNNRWQEQTGHVYGTGTGRED